MGIGKVIKIIIRKPRINISSKNQQKPKSKLKDRRSSEMVVKGWGEENENERRKNHSTNLKSREKKSQ